MGTTEKPRGRGRPRGFDPEAAVATAQRLFHARGYDGVSVADVTQALGINPPSFYAAFGSKAGLYARVLDRWTDTSAIPFADILRPDRPAAEALTAMLEEAARRYAARPDPVQPPARPDAAGCMVLEGIRCADPEARAAARARSVTGERMIRDYIVLRHPDDAGRVADFVHTIMAGMSAQARDGQGLDRLLATARLAGAALAQALPG